MSKRSQQIDALFRQGQHLHMAGRLAEAEQVYRQVLGAMPRHAEALHALAALALQMGHAEAAVSLVDKAIGLKPAADFQLTRAHPLLALRRPDEAARAARSVIKARAASAEAWQVLGHALLDGGDPDGALAAYQRAAATRPDLPDIFNNLGMSLRMTGRLAEAEAALQRAPAEPEALVNLSSVQKERGAFAAAEETLARATALAPENPVVRYNKALLLLLLGREAEARDGWEQRFRAGAVPPRAFQEPQWDGAPLAGRRLLVHTEQGLGDVIQYARFLPGIAGSVTFEAPPRLMRLLASNPAMPPMVPAGGPLPGFDVVVPLMSVPVRSHAARNEVRPAPLPYLFAEAEQMAAWRARIEGQVGARTDGRGLRIGIAWQGFAGRFEDKGRSLPLAAFAPLAAIEGVRLISLQRGEGTEQIAEAGFAVEVLDGLDEGPDAFVDTAAVMMTVDLVVTSDTSIAHLAGALGRDVWVALRRVPDWRWMLERTDSPWYPRMRLFRQVTDGDWGPVFAAIAAEVERWTAR